MGGKKPDILVTASVKEEVTPLIDALSLTSPKTLGGRLYFNGAWKNLSVAVLITGPGMINAAQAHTAAIEKICPSSIIHTGCAGIFPESGGRIGDIALATRETDIHSGIEQDGGILPSPLPFPLLNTDSGPLYGTYPLDQRYIDRAETLLEPYVADSDIRLLKGPFVTVATITATEHKARILTQAFAPVMESMEGASAAHVARHYRIPFLEIRAASNWVGRRDKATWNLPLSFERCSRAVFHMIDRFSLMETVK